MASSNYTPHLQLSKWSGSDKPKRSDFNRDNSQVDAGFYDLTQQMTNHGGNAALHVTQAEKDGWAKGGSLKTTTYVGDGATQRNISLGYCPEFVFVFAVGCGLVQSQAEKGEIAIYSAVVTKAGSTLYSGLTADGFSVRYARIADATGNRISLNEGGVTYVCVHR